MYILIISLCCYIIPVINMIIWVRLAYSWRGIYHNHGDRNIGYTISFIPLLNFIFLWLWIADFPINRKIKK